MNRYLNFYVRMLVGLVWVAFGMPSQAIEEGDVGGRYSLIGVISTGGTQGRTKGIAVIKEVSTGKTLTIKAGEPVPGMRTATLTDVQRNQVTVRAGENTFYIRFGGSEMTERPKQEPFYARMERFEEYYKDVYSQAYDQVEEQIENRDYAYDSLAEPSSRSEIVEYYPPKVMPYKAPPSEDYGVNEAPEPQEVDDDYDRDDAIEDNAIEDNAKRSSRRQGGSRWRFKGTPGPKTSYSEYPADEGDVESSSNYATEEKSWQSSEVYEVDDSSAPYEGEEISETYE